MARPGPAKTRTEVEKLLAKLRDEPVGTDGVQDSVLLPPYEYLMNIGPDHQGKLHWFCPEADVIAIEAATFLLRLFAYNNTRVATWKGKLTICLYNCVPCARSFIETKGACRTTYFGAFPDDVVRRFWSAFEKWQTESIVQTLKDAGIAHSSQKTLVDAPAALVYLMVSTPSILQEPDTSALLLAQPPTTPFPDWPTDYSPPGLFLLVMSDQSELRHWARSHTSRSNPLTKDQFTESHQLVMEAIASAVSSADAPLAVTPPLEDAAARSLTVLISRDPIVIWSGLANVFRLLPAEIFLSSKLKAKRMDLRQLTFGHLHDNAAHFPDVLRCTLYLVKKLGCRVWEGQSEDYPQVIFDAMKDNTALAEMLFTPEASNEKPWFLMWFSEYLRTIWDKPILGEVLAKIAGFMFGELQHERFKASRPTVAAAVLRLLNAVSRKAGNEKAVRQYTALTTVLDVHGDVIVSIAMSREYSTPQWSSARQVALELLRQVFTTDADNLAVTISDIANALPPAEASISPTYQPIRRQVWKSVYDNLQSTDANAIHLMLSVVSRISHFDKLTPKAFSSTLLPPTTHAITRESFDTTVGEVNRALTVFKNGFLDVVSKYANYNPSSTILELFHRSEAVKHVMALLLSPVEDLHVAAQTLVGQAFDVDGRADCFRALLTNLPGPSLRGIMDFMEVFNQYAPQIPEACSISKSLVRCMTDVIEVLCSSPDGLLLKERFLTSETKASRDVHDTQLAQELPKLWRLMTTALAIIFKRTQYWAAYFDSETMVEWMRDALIFGREMLAERRVFESAALRVSGQSLPDFGSPRRLSKIGKKMVDGLQNVLLELARWLRLTDEELLHQSFALLQSLLDCFRQTRVAPLAAAMSKLTKFVEDGRTKGSASNHTRLDKARLSQLEDALGSFTDDDMHIISSKVSKAQIDTSVRRTTSKPSETVQTKLDRGVGSSKLGAPERVRPPDKSKSANLKPGSSPYFPIIIHEKTKPSATGASIKPSAAAKPVPPSQKPVNLSKRSSDVDYSSSESSSSDEDGMNLEGLQSLNKLQKSPKKVTKPPERRQVKMMDAPMQGGKAIQDRLARREDARRTAMRLKPDITPLHRMILSWNYDHDGPDPPFVGKKPSLMRVQDQFDDHQQYLRIFEPLLMLECWSQIMKSKEEPSTDHYGCKLNSRQFIDDWLDLDVSITESVRKDWYLAETDIVLLRQSTGKKSVMGRATGFKNSPLGVQASVRCYLGPIGYDPGLQTGTEWKITKVFSLSTVHREFAALMALPYYDLSQQILQPRLAKGPHIDSQEISRAMSAYQVNEPQAKAIITSMKTDGFSLIQGPPGTGKTWTICGLVGAFMSTRPRPAIAVHVGRVSDAAAEKLPKKKLLLCAPSNAAIDEVAKRLIEGVRDSRGMRVIPKVVRLGADASMNISVKELSLDYLIDQKLNSKDTNGRSPKEVGNEISVIRAELDAVKRSKHEKQEQLASIHDNAAKTLALEDDIKKLNSRRMTLSQQFDRLKDQQKSENRSLDAARRKFRQEVLLEADVICSTLSGAGHDILDQFDFEMVVIDEAAQSIELSSLIPLKYRCSRCIMVGDPQQLPPTVLSSEASRWGYDQSLFVRIQKHLPEAAHLLSIQYRMHPEISRLPSRIFYNMRLTDGPDMAQKRRQPWHSSSMFGVYKFFSVNSGREEQSNSHSLKNRDECQIALALFDRLRREFSSVNFDFKVGIVSMYRAQIGELRRTFSTKYGPDILSLVDFGTVDGFQGQEKDVIILSCVRAGPGVMSVGFLADTRRMNVAITRSRSSLFVIGHAPTLERSNIVWKQIVDDARSRSCFSEVDVAYFRTSPAGHAAKHQIAPAAVKIPEAETLPPIPNDLVTPKGFTLATSQVQAKVNPILPPQSPAGPSNGDKKAPSPNRPNPQSNDTVNGLKRKNEDDASRPLRQVRKTDDGQRPKLAERPPTAKRPKQAASLFIPKKPRT